MMPPVQGTSHRINLDLMQLNLFCQASDKALSLDPATELLLNMASAKTLHEADKVPNENGVLSCS